MPVNGHPIEWGIDKITDEDGQDVPADQYSDYVSISGRISTTNKDGMAAAYLHFGLKSGTVYYSARDGVVYRPASEAGTQTVASSGIAASSSTGSAAGSQSTATARGRQWYNHLNLYAVRGVVTTHEVHPSPVQVLQSTTKRLVVIHSIFSFRYDPVKNGQRISGLVRMQVKSDLYGNDPLDIIVPLDGKSHVRSTFRGRRLCLTPGQSAYYSEFARTLLSELWTARQPDQQIKTLSLVAEGYGAASWDFIDTAWKLNPVVLPFTIYNNRAAIGDGFTKAFSLTINGAKFVLTDPKALNILQRSPIEMPAAIVATYGSDSNFRQKTFAIARRASSMMAKGFDDLIIDAANNPDKFKRNSGYAGGTVSIFAMTWYSAETEVIGTKVASKLLATMPIKTATTILRFTKAADVLVNETNLTPILGKILSKNRPVLAATGGLTVRATTDEIVGSVGSGWSSKMNVQLTPVETTAEVGAQQTNNQVMRNVARLQPNQPAAVKFQELIPGKPNSDFIGHIIRGEGIKSGEVSGAHNMQEFLKYLSSPKGTMIRIIRAEHHPTIRGIIRFEYQVARVDSGGNLIGGFKTAVSKTVYDPKFISDGEYARWICEARQESLLHPSSTVGRLWYGEAKNGLYMKGYLNQQGNVKTGWAWF